MASLRTIDRTRWTTSKALISGTPSSPSELFIAYTRCPRPDGTPKKGTILLIHGYPQFSYQFRHVITPLSDAGYDVIAPDYRGAGNSSKPRGEYTKTAMAADLHALVTEHLSIGDKVHVVGHDIGGMVAHAYASRYPQSTASVTQGEFPLPGTRTYDRFVKENSGVWHFHFHWQADLPELLTAGRERQYIQHFYDRLAVNPAAITKEDVDVYAAAFERAGAMRAGFDVYRAFHKDARDNKAWLEKEGKCKVPCLCLNGEGSFLAEIAEEQTNEMYANSVETKTVPGSGHWCAEENPDFFVKQVVRWIGAQSEDVGK